MSKTLIKICGLTDPDLAKKTAEAGADFIGLVFHPESPRAVSIATAKEITRAVKNKIKIVGVFVNQTATEIQAICQETGIEILQLHGKIAQQQYALLAPLYPCILVQQVEKDKELNELSPPPTYVLYDSPVAGKGVSFDWQQFKKPKNPNWFLAGGLHPNNVAQAISLLQPYAVDVSSGVEIRPGLKDIQLIKIFINAVKAADRERDNEIRSR